MDPKKFFAELTLRNVYKIARESWKIIADNLSKAGWSLAGSQPLIPTGEQSGLQTRIATTESVSLRVPRKT
jgi:hypothetical protein